MDYSAKYEALYNVERMVKSNKSKHRLLTKIVNKYCHGYRELRNIKDKRFMKIQCNLWKNYMINFIANCEKFEPVERTHIINYLTAKYRHLVFEGGSFREHYSRKKKVTMYGN